MTVEIYCNALTRCECYQAYKAGGLCGWDSGPLSDWETNKKSEDLGYCRRGSSWNMYELEDLPSDCPWTEFHIQGGYIGSNTDNCKVLYKNACSCYREGPSRGCGWKSHVRYQDAINSSVLNSMILSITNVSGDLTNTDFKTLGECRWGGETHGSELDDSMGFFGALFEYSPGTDDFTGQFAKYECKTETTCGSLTTPCDCFTMAAEGCGWSSADFRSPGSFFSEQGSRKEWRKMGRCRNGSTTTGYDVAIDNFLKDVLTAPACLGDGTDYAGIDCKAYSTNINATGECQNIQYDGANWTDFKGNGCDWYKQDPTRCVNPEFTPFTNANFGINASSAAGVSPTTACCACSGGVGAKTGRCNCWENAVVDKDATCGWDSQTGTCDYNSRFSLAEIEGCAHQEAWSYAHIDEFNDLTQLTNRTAGELVAQHLRVYILSDNGVFDTCFAHNGDPLSLETPFDKCDCLAQRTSGNCGWVSSKSGISIEVTRGNGISADSQFAVDNNGGFCSSEGAWDAQLGAQEAWKCLITPRSVFSPVIKNGEEGYLFEDAPFKGYPSSKVPFNAPVRGMCDPFNNMSESCECYNHSQSFGSLDFARAKEFDDFWLGDPTFTDKFHFRDLWERMYDFVAPLENWNTVTRDLEATPFATQSCWILYDANGDPIQDTDGNFLPNPNSLGGRCRPERFCGWSDEYISYSNASGVHGWGIATHNDTAACFAGFQFTTEQAQHCPPPPVVPPFEPYATPRVNCSSITDEAECWLYTLKDEDFAPFNLNCAYNHTAGVCEVSDDASIDILFRQLEPDSPRGFLSVTGAVTYDITGTSPSAGTTVAKVGSGGYAYNGLEGYNYTGPRDTAYNTPTKNLTVAIQSARDADPQAQYWKPQVMHLQYERYHRVPFVEKDTCFIIGGWVEPFIEHSYVSYNDFTEAENNAFAETTINQCFQTAGKCTVDSPMLDHDYTNDNKTAAFFQGYDVGYTDTQDRYAFFQTRFSATQLSSPGGLAARAAIIAISSATRAPPTRDLIVPGVAYTHTILGDNLGKPYLYIPCLNETDKYEIEIADYAAGKIFAIDADQQSYFKERLPLI